MALFGLVTASLAFVFAELQGSDRTRGATRAGFLGLLLVEMGLTLSGVVSTATDLLIQLPL